MLEPGGPARLEGIQPGDIITSINATPLDKNQSFVNTLFAYKPGDRVEVEVAPARQTLRVQMTLTELPK
jgi:S1-C subfamily serine protease